MTTQEINDYRISRTLEDAYGYRPQIEGLPKSNDLLIGLTVFFAGFISGGGICWAITLFCA